MGIRIIGNQPDDQNMPGQVRRMFRTVTPPSQSPINFAGLPALPNFTDPDVHSTPTGAAGWWRIEPTVPLTDVTISDDAGLSPDILLDSSHFQLGTNTFRFEVEAIDCLVFVTYTGAYMEAKGTGTPPAISFRKWISGSPIAPGGSSRVLQIFGTIRASSASTPRFIDILKIPTG